MSRRTTQPLPDAPVEVPTAIAVSSGDPAGIGPEITHKAVKRLQRRHEILRERPIMIAGDAFLYARHLPRPAAMHAYHIVPADDFLSDPGYVYAHLMPRDGKPWRPIFVDCGEREPADFKLGRATPFSAGRALAYLETVIAMLHLGLADAVCTAPICKQTAIKAGFGFPGQTELFGAVCGEPNPVMMLVGGGLRVALATIHEPLARVPALLTRKAVRKALRATLQALVEDFGVSEPRVAVCGLNPHAGESGAFGDEEKRVIRPVIAEAARQGWRVTGPLSADTVFAQARAGQFDAVVAMYHDQGLIAVKTVAFDEGVNVTLGLPIVRTSPDHGTAFDIAGKAKAREGSMLSALRTAHKLSRSRWPRNRPWS